jgi:CMP-N-acetylneuraminic acid synthetase
MDSRPEDFLALIPARGGSKGIPRKNVRPFLGRPLLAWTVDVARASGVFARVVVSTEDEEIARVAASCGAEVPFRRPPELAEDAAPTAPVARHAVEWLRDHEGWSPRYVVILEPTSPARRALHVREAAHLLASSGADSLASVTELPHHHNPEKVLRLAPDGTIEGTDGRHVRDMVHRRQDLPRYHVFDGLIFACRAQVLLDEPPTLWGPRVIGYVVEPRYAVDIDRPEDWKTAEVRVKEILEREGAS